MRAAELVAVALDRGADGRGVDDRQHLAEVVADEPVEQHLVTVVQTGQIDVLGEVGGLRTVLRVGAHRLLVLGEGLRRHQAHQAQCRAFLRREGRAAVEPWIGEYGPARRGGLEAVFPGDPLGAHEWSPVVGPRRRGRILGYAGMWVTSLISGSRRTGGMRVESPPRACMPPWVPARALPCSIRSPQWRHRRMPRSSALRVPPRPRRRRHRPHSVHRRRPPPRSGPPRRPLHRPPQARIPRRGPGLAGAGFSSGATAHGRLPGAVIALVLLFETPDVSKNQPMAASHSGSTSPHGAGMQPQRHHPTGCPTRIPPGMHRPR